MTGMLQLIYVEFGDVCNCFLGARSSRTLCSSFTASALIALAPLAFPEAPFMKFVLSSEPCPRLGTASMFYSNIETN